MPRPREPLGELTGTSRPRPQVATFSSARNPYAPKSLNEEGRELWRHLVTLLTDSLDEVDLSALEMLCRSWAMYKQAAAAYEAEPVTQGSRGNLVPSPWFGIMNTEAERCRKLFNAFRLTPEARVKLGALRQDSPLDRELESLLSQ